jgi:glycosyltransferase involved in cell wall biosynthesis
MRVGVDGRSLVGAGGRGVAHHTAGLLGGAAAADSEVEWRVSLPAGASLPGGVAELPNVRGVRHGLPSRLLHGAGWLTGWPRLDRMLDADVVWLPAPAPVALTPGTPFVLTVHDLSFLERPEDFTGYERTWHRLARVDQLARDAARIAAVSGDAARAAIEQLGLEPERVVVVGQGPGDPGPALDEDEAARLRAELGVEAPYLLYIGALEPRKAPDVLAEAWSAARADGLRADLVAAGEGRLDASLREAGATLLGRVSRAQKAALYAGAMAVVLPSWLEGFGLTPLEGYAHGVPAIVSDLPALHETAGHGALFVPAGDAAALAAALLRMEREPALRVRLASAGAEALSRHSWIESGARLRELLEDALR